MVASRGTSQGHQALCRCSARCFCCCSKEHWAGIFTCSCSLCAVSYPWGNGAGGGRNRAAPTRAAGPLLFGVELLFVSHIYCE